MVRRLKKKNVQQFTYILHTGPDNLYILQICWQLKSNPKCLTPGNAWQYNSFVYGTFFQFCMLYFLGYLCRLLQYKLIAMLPVHIEQKSTDDCCTFATRHFPNYKAGRLAGKDLTPYLPSSVLQQKTMLLWNSLPTPLHHATKFAAQSKTLWCMSVQCSMHVFCLSALECDTR